MRIKIKNVLMAAAALLALAALPGQFTHAHAQTRRPGAQVKRAALYACPMHAEVKSRSEERRVGKECRSRWSPYH